MSTTKIYVSSECLKMLDVEMIELKHKNNTRPMIQMGEEVQVVGRDTGSDTICLQERIGATGEAVSGFVRGSFPQSLQ